jgi:hypothetical protein
MDDGIAELQQAIIDILENFDQEEEMEKGSVSLSVPGTR